MKIKALNRVVKEAWNTWNLGKKCPRFKKVRGGKRRALLFARAIEWEIEQLARERRPT